MNIVLAFVILVLTWLALVGIVSLGQILMGMVLALVLLWFGRNVFANDTLWNSSVNILRLPGKLLVWGRFLVVFGWEVIKANWTIAKTVLTVAVQGPNERNLRPGIFALPLDVDSDGAITLLANMITLTPGTLSLDVSPDRTTLYVHAVDVGEPEATKRAIKDGFEALADEVLR